MLCIVIQRGTRTQGKKIIELKKKKNRVEKVVPLDWLLPCELELEKDPVDQWLSSFDMFLENLD